MADPYIGEIRMFAGNFAPVGWMICAGQLLAISENEALFSLIGTTYGGDGVQTFGLPDLRGRIPIHQGNGSIIGQLGGAETVTLTVNQLPAHTHAVNCNSGAANGAATPVNGVWLNYDQNQYTDQPLAAVMNGNAMGLAGGSQPHENRMPYLAINFIISLFGVFPTQ